MTRLGTIIDRKFENHTVSNGDGYTILSSPGNFRYPTATNTTGVPVFDGFDAGNYTACFVGITDADTAAELVVLTGLHANERIFGLSYSDVDGDSIQVQFFSVSPGSPLSAGTPYVWETGQTLSIDLFYPLRQRQDQVDDTAGRFLYASGVLTSGSAGSGGSGITAAQHAALRQLIHLADGGGPFEQFSSGAYREILPSGAAFPTSVTWYEDSSKAKKIVEKSYTYDSNQNPITITWKAYDTDGSTVLATVSDAITYDGSTPFEDNRTRSIS